LEDDEKGAQLSQNHAEYCMLMDREDRPEEKKEGKELKKRNLIWSYIKD
jgi:hypothetical protein